MPAIQYDAIASRNYQEFISAGNLSNDQLRNYFNACFQEAIDLKDCYPAWACIECIEKSTPTTAFGNKPSRCTLCNSKRVYEIGTFQGRASVVGGVFEKAIIHLLRTKFELPAVSTPGNTRTHDIEITSAVAIESKGSPRRLLNPDGTATTFPRPGLERSDTWKKAQANARNFRAVNRVAPFFILSNAVPHSLVGYRSDDITGIFNITQASRVASLISEINRALTSTY